VVGDQLPNGRDFFDENDRSLRDLSQKFSTYTLGIDIHSVRNFLNQFGENKDLGMKLLQNVDYYSSVRINQQCRELLDEIKSRFGDNLDNVIFIPFGDEGKSGHSTLTTFRRANNLSNRRHNEKFKHLSQITELVNIEEVLNETKPPEEQESNEEQKEPIKIIFIDDFIGSGQQAIEYYFDNINAILEILPQEIEMHLAVLVGYEDGINRFEEETNRSIIVVNQLNDRNKLFSHINHDFNDEEKRILRELCGNAGDFPTGFNDIQSTVVFHYRSPNNTISILRCSNENWKGLFPRRL